ncbi:outer membrane porin GjpA [Mycobacterium simulans]|uniref:outer membrane porin GjpA n=1 Tax=Mycobacterium simulans TaxID=627089 RepID=UPI001748D7C3|nr:outer membrane porin GjpA [Mycobacterium simulans]
MDTSFVITPEPVHGAAQGLAGIGSSLAEATATVSGPTTGIAAAAADEVSIAIASMFGEFGEEFQALSSHAQAFHSQFVNAMNAGVGAYTSAEVANAQQTLLGGWGTSGAPAAASVDPITRWQQVLTTTTQNAQTVFGAWDAGLSALAGGVCTGFSHLATNPAGFFANLQTAARSVPLIDAPNDVALAVAQHTLGDITSTIGPPPGNPVLVNDSHGELYTGLIADFFPTGPEGVLLTGALDFAASPLSGVLMGAVGPFVSPGVALFNSVGNIVADITGGNPTGALYGLMNTPANVVDGFFNGATLNLDPLAPVVNQFVAGPTGGTEQVTGLSLGFGGLFSTGQVVAGASGPMYAGVGGSLLNSVGVELTFVEQDFQGVLPIHALGVGPIAATANLFSIVGQALGATLLG